MLSLFRRKAKPAEEAAAPPPTLAPHPPVKARSAAAADDGDGMGGDMVVSRRQGSQVNLNKMFLQQPAGLSAALKNDAQPSSADVGGYGAQPAYPAYPARAETPNAPTGAKRERRKSLTLSEMSAAAGQQVTLTHAAAIMMPKALRQELGPAVADVPGIGPRGARGTLGAGAAAARLGTPSLGGPAGGDGAAASSSGSGLGSGAAFSGARELDRRPSLLREAVKQTTGSTGQQTSVSGGLPASASRGQEAHLRTHAAAFGGELQQASLAQLASALAGQGPERQRNTERRASQLMSLNQMMAGLGAAGTGGNSSISGAAPAPTPTGHAAAVRASSSGAPLAPTPLSGGVAAGPADAPRRMPPSAAGAAVHQSADGALGGGGGGAGRGINRSWGSAAEEGTGSEKDLRRSVPTAFGHVRSANGYHASDAYVGEAGGYGNGNGYGYGFGYGGNSGSGDAESDSRLPSLPPPRGAPPRPAASYDGAAGEPPVRLSSNGAVGGGGGGGGRGVTASDVAALNEAITAAQNEAGRLRAAALRKMDTRIKRAVMDKLHGSGEDDTGRRVVAADAPNGGYGGTYGTYGRSPLPPPMNGRVPMRGEALAPLGGGAGGVDAVSRARARLQEAESEAKEELSHLRKNSNLGARIPAELLFDAGPLLMRKK